MIDLEQQRSNSDPTYLDLESEAINDDRARALAEALKTNKTLTHLILDSNSIGDDGARALAEALKTNKTITDLYITEINLVRRGCMAKAHETGLAVAPMGEMMGNILTPTYLANAVAINLFPELKEILPPQRNTAYGSIGRVIGYGYGAAGGLATCSLEALGALPNPGMPSKNTSAQDINIPQKR